MQSATAAKHNDNRNQQPATTRRNTSKQTFAAGGLETRLAFLEAGRQERVRNLGKQAQRVSMHRQGRGSSYPTENGKQ
jgi:hypothetical protein